MTEPPEAAKVEVNPPVAAQVEVDPPVAAEVEAKLEKVEEEKPIARGYPCGLCDTELVHKIAQELLPGLASACVDNTTGGIFKTAGSIAVDMRKEMVEYLTQRSETFVAEFILAENAATEEISEHPYDIITSLIDDFTGSKRNMFSRVSEWVLSDRREDRIDDFVQEMEINGFWLLARRETIASMLLKNVDYKNAFHCNTVCRTEEELAEHRSQCQFRPMDCTSEGCTTRYSAAQKESHEAVCPFMILPCEQKCPEYIMRREMDRHCVTVCPMKLVSCAFNTVGCEATIPRCQVEQHNVESLPSHLLCIIRTAHKEASDEDLKKRVEQIQNLSNNQKLGRARDARSLTYLIKDVEAKLGPLEIKKIVESKEIYTIEEEETAESPSSEDGNRRGSPTKTEPSSTEKPAIEKDVSDSPKKTEHPRSPVKTEESKDKSVDSPVKTEESKDKVESSSEEKDEHRESPVKNEVSRELSVEGGDNKELVAKEEEQKESPKGETINKPSDEEESAKSPKKETIEEERSKESSSSDEGESTKSPIKETVKEKSSSDEEQSAKSASNTES